jgi:hypothetical protein
MRPLALLAVVVAVTPAAAADSPYQRTLTSTSKNIRTPSWELKDRDAQAVVGSAVPWGVHKETLHGGRQEGVEVVVVDNGKLVITVVPTRGMGILSVKADDLRLGWDSPVKDVVHPREINLQSRGGLGWLEGFNEFMVRCGLESNGQPGTDKFVNNVGDEATMELTLHGKIANLPAQEVEVLVERQPPYRITVRGRVDERMFYGPKLELQTEISTEIGSDSFRISDTITNHGGQPQEFEVLYHTNCGRPLLEAGAQFVGPVERATPFNDHAAKDVKKYDVYGPPQTGFIEQVYLLRLHADKQERTKVMLRNKAGDRAMSMNWSLKELPYMTLWKNTAAEKDGYVTGLEPGTNYPNNRRVERQFGRVPKLAPGASHKATIEIGAHVGADAVKRVAAEIAGIQGERQPTLDSKPAPKEPASKP